MVGVSVVQVAQAVRHTPLPALTPHTGTGHEDYVKHMDAAPAAPLQAVGGFVGGGQLAWRAAGPTVELLDPVRGTRKAAWTFGAVLHNGGAQVTSVCGVGRGAVSHVVVGVDLGADRRPRGMVALLSLRSSRVTRAFHFQHRVTKVCMASGGEQTVDSGTLAPELRHWQGLLVVGTAHGTLHLLDLALDLGGHKVLSDEVSPGTLAAVTTPDPAAEHTRVTALRQRCHPTMCLSDGMSSGGRFQLLGPDDNVLFEVASQRVAVTALAFFPQLAALVVGYNFGAFQIINLSTITIDCASPYEESMPPVLSFACQEPENDPKNYMYLWLCRSWPPQGSSEGGSQGGGPGSHALCTLYAMIYDSKVWIEGHGLWFQGLASISPRFEFDILGGLGLRGPPEGPSRVFSATTVQLSTPPAAAAAAAGGPSLAALTPHDEDSGSVLEQSLCVFGWVGGVREGEVLSLHHYLAVFDINQWYQAQMPSSLKLEESQLCPYMSFHLLDRVPGVGCGGAGGEAVLGAAPKPASWAQHTSHTCNDSDWFPAALSYDAHVVTSGSLVEYRCPSTQQAALALLSACGPAAVVDPQQAHAACVFAGLIPSDPAHHSLNSSASAMMLEREAVLNVALDQQLISLLVQCVREFSEGRFSTLGCSLPALLDWAWHRVTEIKASNDTLSLPLFDPECGVVSTDTIALLHQNLTHLITLTTIITTIRDNAHANLITAQGCSELEGRVRVVGLVVVHSEAVLWFHHCGLLCPAPLDDPGDDAAVPFPAHLLARIYKNRRSEISHLSASLTGNEVLMIDGLLEEAAEACGGSLGGAWEEEGGGAYPPPSLHALLTMFLLPYVPTTTKHRIVQYLFLDLASLLSDGYVRVVEELVKYPSSFSLSPSLIKLTQAFWLLDHKDFQEGLNVLLDPLVNPCDLTPWQHKRIMKAFLYQGEHGRALTYAKLRRPPKVDVDDIRLHLTLLLANRLVREAFHYQRSHRTHTNTHDLLQHFFTGCEQQGGLESVIHLPLSPLEEAALVDYLRTSTSTAAHDYLLVYYLQRARYDDAALLQDSLRGGLGTARRRHGARSALVHGYLTHLPDVAQRLSSTAAKRSAPERVLYKKPPPLSAHIRQSSANAKSRASTLEHHLNTPTASTDPYTPFRNAAQRRRAYEMADFDDHDLLVTPKRKGGSRDASHVVFPSPSSSPAHFMEARALGVFSPAAGRRSLAQPHSQYTTTLLNTMDSMFKQNKSRFSMTQTISADMLSLLQTPKIMRKRRSENRPGLEDTMADSPQSILKVRQMVQRPLSPSAASDASVPVFPRLSARKAKTTAAAAAAVVEESALTLSRSDDPSLTPKQLRFHLPKVAAREKLRARRASRYSASTDEHVEEEEEGVEEEEEMVEEEEEMVEEEEEEEEPAQRVVGRRPMLSFDSERRQTAPGLPTPRQPLHGTALPDSWLSPQPRQPLDSEGYTSPQDEASLDLPSRETTLNDMFYSFEEEGEAVREEEEGAREEEEEEGAQKEEEEEEEQMEEATHKEEEEEGDELDGVEISREVAETDEDELFTEEAENMSEAETSDDLIPKMSAEETQREQREDLQLGDKSKASQDTGHESVCAISDTSDIEEEEELNLSNVFSSTPDKLTVTPYQVTGERQTETSQVTGERQTEKKQTETDQVTVERQTETDQVTGETGERQKPDVPIIAPSVHKPPGDATALKEESRCPGKRVDGVLREDEGFSEYLEPATAEGQEKEEEMEVSGGGQALGLNTHARTHSPCDEGEGLDLVEGRMTEGEEEKETDRVGEGEGEGEEKETDRITDEQEIETKTKEQDIDSSTPVTESHMEEGKISNIEESLSTEQKDIVQDLPEKIVEEKEKTATKMTDSSTETETVEGEVVFGLAECVSTKEEEEEVHDLAKDQVEEKEKTEPVEGEVFSLAECVATKEREAAFEHCITTQEEEMIAEAVSEEELCLNLESDDESPGQPDTENRERESDEENRRGKREENREEEEEEENRGGKREENVEMNTQGMETGVENVDKDEKMDTLGIEEGVKNDQIDEDADAFVAHARTQPSEKSAESADAKLTSQKPESTVDETQEKATAKDSESTTKDTTEEVVVVNKAVLSVTTTTDMEPEPQHSEEQLNQTFVVEEKEIPEAPSTTGEDLDTPQNRKDEALTSSTSDRKTSLSEATNVLEAAAVVKLGSVEQDMGSDVGVVPMDEAEEMVVSEVDGGSPAKRRKIEKHTQESSERHHMKEYTTPVSVEEPRKEGVADKIEEEDSLAHSEMESESAVAVAERDRETSDSERDREPSPLPREEGVSEGMSGSSPAPSQSLPQQTQDLVPSHTQGPTESAKDPTESAKDPTESAKDPIESAKDPTESAKDPIESAQGPTESAQGPTESAQGPTESAKDPMESAKNPTESAKDPTESAKDPTESAKDPIESAKDPIESAKDPMESAKDHTESAKDRIESAKDPIESAKDPMDSATSAESLDHDSASITPSRRRSARHTPPRELATTPLRRSSRRLSGASTSSAPSTPKRTTRATTPARDDADDNAITRSGRKLQQVPTPHTRSRGSPGSPLVTPSRRTRKMSGSQEEVLKVSQKLLLTPEGTAEDGDVSSPHRQEATKSVPSVPTTPLPVPLPTTPLPVPLPTTPLPATPTRRSARKTHTDTLETISEDKVVVSEGRARTPSKDTPSKATRTRKLSATEALETIAENAVLTITEDTHTPATPRRSSRKKCVSPLVSAVLATPKSRRRSSSESHNEETTQPKSLRRTRRLSGDLEKLTPQKRTSRMKGEQSDTPAKGAVMEGTAEKEGGSVARRTRRQSLSHSEGSVVEGERGRQGSVTSFAESMSMSASPARSTPVTSIKDSESSEEDGRVGRRQRVRQRQSKGEGEETVNPRKSRRLTQTLQPGGKAKRKSMHALKIPSLSEEASHFMDTLDTGKGGGRRASRRKTLAGSPSTSVILLGGAEEAEAEVEDEVEVVLKAGLDVEDSVTTESESGEGQEMGQKTQTKRPRGRPKGSGKKKQQSGREEQTARSTRLRNLVIASATQNKPKRKLSIRLHSLSEEASHFMDALDTGKGAPRRASRKKASAGSPSTSVILLGGAEEAEAEVEVEEAEAEEEDEDIEDSSHPSTTTTTTTTTTKSPQAKQRAAEATEVVGGAREEGKVGEEEKEAQEVGVTVFKAVSDATVAQEAPQEAAAATQPEFKFAEPKMVSAKREKRALENLTSEAVNFLFSPPLAAGRIAKQQSKAEEGTSSSESEAETGRRRTKRKNQ